MLWITHIIKVCRNIIIIIGTIMIIIIVTSIIITTVAKQTLMRIAAVCVS